jgi:hypothetical protein
VILTKDESNETAWHKAAEKYQVEILEKLCDRAKILQLKPEALRKELFLSKDTWKNSMVQAAERGQVEILKKQWDWAKVLHVKREWLRNEVVVSTHKYVKTTWHKTAESGQIENLEKPWYLANELQLQM